METLILQTENNSATKEILQFIKKMKSVKFVSVESSNKKLTPDNWSLPGRPATESEMDEMATLLDNETSFKKSDDVFESIIGSIKK